MNPTRKMTVKKQKSRKNQARSDAGQQIHKLSYLRYEDLVKAASILGGNTVRQIKGGITARLSLEQLRHEIRSSLGRGTFTDRVERFTDFLETCIVSDEIVTELTKPEIIVQELINAIKRETLNLPDLVLFELVNDWLNNPEGDFNGDYDYLEKASLDLGFNYFVEESENTVTVAPSPMLLKRKISDMSDSEFYHSFIFLAGQGLDKEKFSPPPNRFKAGYNFLSQLVAFLKNQNSTP